MLTQENYPGNRARASRGGGRFVGRGGQAAVTAMPSKLLLSPQGQAHHPVISGMTPGMIHSVLKTCDSNEGKAV